MKSPIKAFIIRLKSPKWRHGLPSALIMLGIAAACVLINIGIKSLEEKNGWKADLSFNRYATTGEQTARVLSSLKSDVDLYLLYTSGDEYERLRLVLERYSAQSGHISAIPTDITKNPGILTRFKDDNGSALGAGTVIAYCEATDRSKALSYERFFTQGFNLDTGAIEVEGLAFEKELTEAIVYVTEAAVPSIGLLQGHGELTEDDMRVFTSFLQSNSYDVKAVNLARGGTLDDIDLLVIAGAQKDLNGAELDMASVFMQNGGSMLFMRDYADPLDMPNLLSLLRSYGVVPLSGAAVAREQDKADYYMERMALIPYMCETEMTLPLIMNGLDLLLMPGAGAFETPTAGDTGLYTEQVLKTSAGAYLRDLSDGSADIERREGDRSGELCLAMLGSRTHASGKMSRIFAIGGSAVFTDEYIYRVTFNEEFILQLLGGLIPQKSVSLDIKAASAFRPEMKVGSRTLGIALIAVIPIAILISALCVLIPRRNR